MPNDFTNYIEGTHTLGTEPNLAFAFTLALLEISLAFGGTEEGLYNTGNLGLYPRDLVMNSME